MKNKVIGVCPNCGANVADKLLRDGRVRLKDCKSAKGKTYNATVLLGTEPDGRSKFSLEFEGGWMKSAAGFVSVTSGLITIPWCS